MIIDGNGKTRTRRYRGSSYVKPIDEANRLVSVPKLAEKLSGAPGARRGREIAFRCPLHDDHDPSLRVDPERGVWFCDPCLVGGDAVELYRLVQGFDQRDAHVAAAMLLMEFGHEVPQRPDSWRTKQERQKPVRDALEQVKTRIAQRRLMRAFGPLVASIENPDERREEAQRIWHDLDEVARLVVKGASR